jgi:hypothetical protein
MLLQVEMNLNIMKNIKVFEFCNLIPFEEILKLSIFSLNTISACFYWILGIDLFMASSCNMLKINVRNLSVVMAPCVVMKTLQEIGNVDNKNITCCHLIN